MTICREREMEVKQIIGAILAYSNIEKPPDHRNDMKEYIEIIHNNKLITDSERKNIIKSLSKRRSL